MCGRYTIYTKKESLEERFDAEMTEDYFDKKHFNAAPSQMLPVVENSAPEMIQFSYWGFLPSWSKPESKMRAMINARAETIAEKPFFRGSFKHKRCLVLADGFYEWDQKGNQKIPYYIYLKSKKPFAMAGIWDESENENKQPNSFAIITTNANSLMKNIHERMPVILENESEKIWLDEGTTVDTLHALLKPFDPHAMEMHQVANTVNSPKNNSEELIVPTT